MALYFDHAAATPIRREALKAMLPYFSLSFGNPSSIHKMGREAKKAMESAREHVAALVGARKDAVVFTSGATESINLALFGSLRAHASQGSHIVATAVEHKATLEALKRGGFEVTLVPVDRTGLVKAEDVIAAIRPDTVVVSVMAVNNEVGTVNPIHDIGKGILRLKKERGSVLPYFHVDASQAVRYIDLNVEHDHIDLLSFSAAKIGGPKGVGALALSPKALITPILVGGNQESGRRAGTENVPGIVGFGVAAQLALAEREKEAKKLGRIRHAFLRELKKHKPGVTVNGHETQVAPHIVNISMPGKDSEEIVLRLDAKDIFISSASACTNPGARSHVLRAMGFSEAEIASSIRISFGHTTKRKDALALVHALTLL